MRSCAHDPLRLMATGRARRTEHRLRGAIGARTLQAYAALADARRAPILTGSAGTVRRASRTRTAREHRTAVELASPSGAPSRTKHDKQGRHLWPGARAPAPPTVAAHRRKATPRPHPLPQWRVPVIEDVAGAKTTPLPLFT